MTFSTSGQIVRMETVLGNIDIELRADVAPNTVANFLTYVNDTDYDNSYIHRSIANFIIQGGGFTFENGASGTVLSNGTVDNEFNLSNVRGTIAMAKVGGNPDSATSQWFFNTADNSSNLDAQNGGFTVFGSVINGMDVVDTINSLSTITSNSLPVTSGNQVASDGSNLVLLNSVYLLDDIFHMNLGLNGAWYNQNTAGQGILFEILPQTGTNVNDLAFMAWFTYDTEQPADGSTANIGDTGHRWMTGIGEVNNDTNSITFDLSLTTGGLFDNELNTNTSSVAGSMTITFENCNNAIVSYELVDQELSRSFPVIRAATNTELCTRLSAEAARETR